MRKARQWCPVHRGRDVHSIRRIRQSNRIYATDWTYTSHASQQTPRSDRQPNKYQRQLSDQLLLDRDPLENGQRRVAYKFLFLNVCGVKIKFNYQEFTEFIIM